MKVVCISDTHGHHEKLDLPEGDLIIHSGDFSAHLSSVEESGLVTTNNPTNVRLCYIFKFRIIPCVS